MLKFDLENEEQCQGKKLGLRYSTGNIDEFIFKIFATWEHTFMQKDTYTCTHTARDRGDGYRQNLQRRFA